MTLLTPELLRTMPLPKHEGEVDKDSRGRALCIGGSAEIPGGILLAALGAMRAGAGKVQVATVASQALVLAVALPEARVIGLDEGEGEIATTARERVAELAGRADAVVIGPGMANAQAAEMAALAALGLHDPIGVVLDAAAIGELRFASRACQQCKGSLVLTPHAGEMASLMDADIDAVTADPERFALEAAATFGAVVAMKGGVTHVAAPDGQVWRFEGGCIGLATSGSGDVLAGIIGGLLARGADAVTATLWGVHLHGAAGRKLSERHGAVGLLAREIPAEVPALMASLA